MSSICLRRQVVSPKSVRLAVSVVEKTWGLGLKSPPELDVWLSSDELLRIAIDDVTGVTSFRLFDGGGDCVGKEVPPHRTGIDGEVLDGLLEEVRESNRRWWAENES